MQLTLSDEDGLHWHEAGIWLDPRVRRALAFVSSAWGGPPPSHERALMTPFTARLLKASGRGAPLMVPYYRPFSLGELDLELLPSGLMPGAAQLLIQYQETRLLYCAGPGPLEGGPCVQAPEVRRCDALALSLPVLKRGAESSFGRWGEQITNALQSTPLVVVLLRRSSAIFELVSQFQGEADLWIHPGLTHHLRACRALGGPALQWREYRRRQGSRQGIIFAPQSQARNLLAQEQVMSWVGEVDDLPEDMGCYPAPPLSPYASLEALKHFVDATKANQVFLAGAGAEAIAPALRSPKRYLTVIPSARQLSLF